jgi:hypothetical protein
VTSLPPAVPFATATAHTDENGEPCAHHPAVTVDAIFAHALVGSRASGFNHDIASKLQGLMMALDEISELAEADPNLSRAAEGAHIALKEVLATLNANRALTKPPTRVPIALTELTTRAGERVYVTFRGDLPAVDLDISAPTTIHALALLLDISSGPGRGRVISVDTTQSSTHVTLTFTPVLPLASNAPEALALASYTFARDGGSLRCADNGTKFVVSFPLAK